MYRYCKSKPTLSIDLTNCLYSGHIEQYKNKPKELIEAELNYSFVFTVNLILKDIFQQGILMSHIGAQIVGLE